MTNVGKFIDISFFVKPEYCNERYFLYKNACK